MEMHAELRRPINGEFRNGRVRAKRGASIHFKQVPTSTLQVIVDALNNSEKLLPELTPERRQQLQEVAGRQDLSASKNVALAKLALEHNADFPGFLEKHVSGYPYRQETAEAFSARLYRPARLGRIFTFHVYRITPKGIVQVHKPAGSVEIDFKNMPESKELLEGRKPARRNATRRYAHF